MTGTDAPSVSSSLRWADELDDIDSDEDGLDPPDIKSQASEEAKSQSSDVTMVRSIESQGERTFPEMKNRSLHDNRGGSSGLTRERSFGDLPRESNRSYEADRMRQHRVIDPERTDAFSRDHRDSMNRRTPRNSKKTVNRKSKFEQPNYDEDSWRCPSNTADHHNRLSPFNTKNEDDRSFYGLNRRGKEENSSTW